MELTLKNIFFIISLGVILIAIPLSIFPSKNINHTVLFRQPSESTPAKHILVHIPEKEIFMSTLHPAASLYEDVTDEKKVKECFNNLDKVLKDKNIELITVHSALKINRTALRQLAFESLKYELEDNINIDKNS